MAEAFACDLLEAFRADLLRYFTRRGHDRELVEDAVQVIALRMAAHGTVIDEPGAWRYLLTAVGRTLSDLRKRTSVWASLESVAEDGSGQALHELIADSRPQPDQEAVGLAGVNQLMEAAASLPPAEQQAVRVLAEGGNSATLARAMGTTKARARVTISRARANLRKVLTALV